MIKVLMIYSVIALIITGLLSWITGHPEPAIGATIGAVFVLSVVGVLEWYTSR